MGSLIVVHKPPGYEGWKDEKPIPRPNLRAILYIIGAIFACGFTCASTATIVYFQRSNSDPKPVAIAPTHTMETTINVIQQSPIPTIEPTPTIQPTVEATVAVPDLQATLDYLKTLPTLTPQPIAVTTTEPVFCDGSTFESYDVGSTLHVEFQNVGALRLLDGPRLRDEPAPHVIRQLYDGNVVKIEGTPVCGFWNGEPVVYYPVYAPRWDERGYVGFGHNSDVWLSN